jgi:hypothetical protein
MMESFLKGGILLFSKEAIIRFCRGIGAGEVTSGLAGGFGGGVSQVFNTHFNHGAKSLIYQPNRKGSYLRALYFPGHSRCHW